MLTLQDVKFVVLAIIRNPFKQKVQQQQPTVDMKFWRGVKTVAGLRDNKINVYNVDSNHMYSTLEAAGFKWNGEEWVKYD